jgi:hypothetical protein
MIVHCPSCSTGFHFAGGAATVLRCSRCSETFPCPTHRRSYVLAPVPVEAGIPASVRYASRAVEAIEPPRPVPAATPPPPPMHDLDAELFAPKAPPQPHRLAVRADRRRGKRHADTGQPAGLVALALAALGATAAWFGTPVLTDRGNRLGAWIASLPVPIEPWMMGAAGASLGLILGGVWLAWRAARR